MLVLALAAPRVSADTAADQVWADVNVAIASEDYDAALVLLAELSVDPTQQGLALIKAAEIYLHQSRHDQAIAVLEQAMALPGFAEAANPLVKLLYRQQAYAEIVRVAHLDLSVPWEPDVLHMVRHAHHVQGEAVPDALGDTGQGAPEARSRLAWTVSGSSCVSEYAPFSDDRSIRDTEMYHELSLGLSRPWRHGLTLRSRLSLERAESEADPDSYAAYRTWLHGLRGGATWQALPWLAADVEAGAVLAAIDSDADTGGHGQESEWVHSVSLTGGSQTQEIRLGAYQDVFGSPTWSGYAMEKGRGRYAELTSHPRDDCRIAARFEDLHFTGDLEDYQVFGGAITWYPALLPSVSLTGGDRHELRDRDENILVAGADWVGRLGAATTVFASILLNANVSTREREIVAELALSRKRGTRRFTLGLSGRQELNVDERRAAQVFFRVE